MPSMDLTSHQRVSQEGKPELFLILPPVIPCPGHGSCVLGTGLAGRVPKAPGRLIKWGGERSTPPRCDVAIKEHPPEARKGWGHGQEQGGVLQLARFMLVRRGLDNRRPPMPGVE